MADILVILMGVMDILAGALIMFAFDFKLLTIIFGVLMVFKGVISLNFFD